jgi:hypothetical protein
MRKLQDRDGSGTVTMPKQCLRMDGLLEEDGSPTEQCAKVERLGRRTYVVRFSEEHGELPEITEAPLIQQVAAQLDFDSQRDPDPDAGRAVAGVTEDDKV